MSPRFPRLWNMPRCCTSARRPTLPDDVVHLGRGTVDGSTLTMSCEPALDAPNSPPDASQIARRSRSRVPVLLHQALHPDSWVNSPSMSRWRARVWLRASPPVAAPAIAVLTSARRCRGLSTVAPARRCISVQKGVAHPGAHRRAARQLRERAELHVDLALELSRLRGGGEASVASWGLEGRARAGSCEGVTAPALGGVQRIIEGSQEWGAEGGDAHLLAQLLPRAGRHRKPTIVPPPPNIASFLRASAGRCGEIWTWGCPQIPRN